jgi:hypothetical protein
MLPASSARADSTWIDHYRAARAAHAAGDLARFRSHLRTVASTLGEQPGIQYNLACAAARLGERDEALRRLELYARSGMTRDVASDSDFVGLWNDPLFRSLASRIRANGDSIGVAILHHRFSDPGWLVEDVAYDPDLGSFFVTSVVRGRVIEIAPDGVERIWTDLEARPGFGAFGACVDAGRRLLWTSFAATPTTAGYQPADSGRTGVIAWNLDTHRAVRRIEWPRDGRRRLLGDLTVGPDGTVYACDSQTGAVRMVLPGADTLATLIQDGGLEGPQTPAVAADGRRLYVADYSRGIAVIDLRTRALTWATFAPGIGLQGIDGLYAFGRELIAVQNGTRPKRVVRLRLDHSGTRVVEAVPIESGTRRLGEPTHAVIVGKTLFFLANTGWERVGDDQTLGPGSDPPTILRIELGPRR